MNNSLKLLSDTKYATTIVVGYVDELLKRAFMFDRDTVKDYTSTNHFTA